MHITKLIHSCLVVENDQKKILVDPGCYSWQNEQVKTYDFTGLSAVVVTHAHPDHFDEDFVRAVHAASPDAVWYGTSEVVSILEKLGIQANTSSTDGDVRFVDSQHADLSPWYDVQPEHTSYVLLDDLLISGDCQTIDNMHGARVLAGAINGGPWGAVVGFAKMVQSMENRPQVVIPTHDWHWNDAARQGIYAQLPGVMAKFGIRFEPLETGVTKDIV